MAVKLLEQNKLINAGLDIWERGTSFVSPGAGYTYTADRFAYFRTGTATHTISKSSDLPAGYNGYSSILMDCTLAQASIGTLDNYGISQKIEGVFFKELAGKYLVLEFWVKATKTGTYCVAFRNADRTRSLVKEYTISASGVWERKTIRILHSTVGTWFYDFAIGIEVLWTVACGNTYMSSPDSWVVGNFIATPNQVNGCDNAANNFQISLPTFIQDSSDQKRTTDFLLAGRDFGEELQLCQRYYEESNNTPSFFNGQASKIWWVPYKVVKRAVPVVTVFGQASGTVQPVYQAGIDGFGAYLTATTTGNANYVSFRADAEL